MCVGLECDRDEDCKSDYCKKPIVGTNLCAAKLENDKYCVDDKHCKSRNCELIPLLAPLKHCKPYITSTGPSCYKDTQFSALLDRSMRFIIDFETL